MKIQFKVHPKCSSTDLEILLNTTTWNIYGCEKSHYSSDINTRIEAFNNLGYKNPIEIIEVNRLFQYTLTLEDSEILSYKLRKLYFENNGLLDDHPEDRIEDRTDWCELNDLYVILMEGLSELMSIKK